MKKLLFVTLSLCFVQLIKAATTDQNVNITVDNETRNYQLYVPNNIQSNCPLVISLHGANGHSTDRSPFVTGVADNAGCIVAYPQGKQTAFPTYSMRLTAWDMRPIPQILKTATQHRPCGTSSVSTPSTHRATRR